MTKFEPNIRRAWGWTDGRADRAAGRTAAWAHGWQTSGHPFDRMYGEGYWAAMFGKPHPVTGETI